MVKVCIQRDLHSRLEGDGDSPFLASLASGYETELDLKGKKVVAVLSGSNIDAELGKDKPWRNYQLQPKSISGSS